MGISLAIIYLLKLLIQIPDLYFTGYSLIFSQDIITGMNWKNLKDIDEVTIYVRDTPMVSSSDRVIGNIPQGLNAVLS